MMQTPSFLASLFCPRFIRAAPGSPLRPTSIVGVADPATMKLYIPRLCRAEGHAPVTLMRVRLCVG